MRYLLALILVAFTLIGCGLTAAAEPTPTVGLPAFPMGAVVTVTAPSPAGTPAPTVTPPLKTPSPRPPVGCEPGEDTPIQYDLDAQIDGVGRTAAVQMRAAYRNLTGQALAGIVLNVDANRTPGTFSFDLITVEAPYAISRYTLNGARLEVIFSEALPPGCRAVFNLNFSVRVPPLAEARMKYFSATETQINLGHWLPEFAPYIGGEWRTPKAWPVGEYIYSEQADFRARVILQGGPGQFLIGPGEAIQEAANVWTFDFPAGRSFPLVVATGMTRRTAQTADGLQIDLYTFTDRTTEATAMHALKVAQTAAEQFTARFGPLPYRRLVVVEGDFPDGMEFSGLVYVGHQWFAGYQGNFDSWLTLITAHEIAHQWWYALVMTAQGDAPYLDESLALYCELLYLEGVRPDLVGWWWGFRVRVHQPKGYVDAPVYEYGNVRLYINAAYLRGAQMLQEVRERIGEEAFEVWLREYIRAAGAGLATPTVFWAALGEELYRMTADIRLKYLRNPEVVNPPEAAPENTPAS